MDIASQIKFETYKNTRSIVNCIAVILGIVGLIFMFVSNATPGYGFADFGLILFALIVGIVVSIAALIFEPILGAQSIIMFVCKFVAIAGITIGLTLILYPRIMDASALFSWDNENEVGFAAFTTGVIAIASLLVADIALVFTSFLKDKE